MKKLFLTVFLIALIIAGGIAYYFYSTGGPKEPEFVKLENIKFKDVTLPPNLKLTLTADAVLRNPNPFSVEISKMEFDVFANDLQATTIKQIISSKMPANEDFKLPIEFDVPLQQESLLKDLKSIISGTWKKQKIKLRSVGTITVKAAKLSFDIPFEHEDEYRLEDYIN